MATRCIVPTPIRQVAPLGPMNDERARDCIGHILTYFERMERAANLRGRRLRVRHYQECWLTVWEACYGADHEQPEQSLPIPTPAAVSARTVRPVWFQEKYSRPLRKVTARVARRLACSGGGAASLVEYELLECGHSIECLPLAPGDKPAKRRRCKECGANTCQEISQTSSTSSCYRELSLSPRERTSPY